jgi:hypothetical protein
MLSMPIFALSPVKKNTKLATKPFSPDSSRRIGYGSGAAFQPPLSDGSSHSVEKGGKKQQKSSVKAICQQFLVTAGCYALMFSAAFYLGQRCERFMTTQVVHNSILDTSLNDVRDEILLDQEKLLLALTRLSHEKQEVSTKEAVNTETPGSGEKKEGSSETLVALDNHIELLKKQLNLTTHKLHEEKLFRYEAEAEVKEAWGSYSLYTSALKETQKNQARHLARLFDNLAHETFGAGPHYVQLQLDVPNSQESSSHEFSYLTIELASLKYMPTAVFYFLKQVDAGLWDGRYFSFNDPHFLLTDLTLASDSIKLPLNSQFARTVMQSQRGGLEKMTKMGLGHLPFSEYSEYMPHTEYSVGFRPGDGMKDRPGPAFFINKSDNTKDHAGQPCFGKVIIGQHVVDQIGRVMGQSGDVNSIEPVGVQIVSATILHELSDAVGSGDYLKKLKDEI